MRLNNLYELEKQGGVVSEILGPSITNMLRRSINKFEGVNPATAVALAAPLAAAPIIGSAVAGMTKTRTDEEQIKADKASLRNLIPGIGEYNFWKRLGHLKSELKREGMKGEGATTSEILGPMVAPLASLGLIAGGMAAKKDPLVFTGYGALAASMLAQQIGNIAAALTKTRSTKEQLKAEEGKLKNIIPGVGEYNLWKRIGYAKARQQQRKKENK